MSYDALLKESPQATIFCTRWWLDAVAPGQHQIVSVDKGGTQEAAWPLVEQRSRLPGRVFGMPPLTPWLGILLSPKESHSLSTRLANEKKHIEALVRQLPPFADLHALFHPTFDYWLPLHWQGFTQTTWYSYALTDISDEDKVWAGLHKNVRQTINKARRLGLEVEVSNDLDAFWELHRSTFSRQGLAMPYGRSLVDRVDKACAQEGARRILLARGPDGVLHAGAYIVWDSRSAYYLMGGGDPARRASGAASLTMWEAIRFAASVTEAFDFEGSSLQPVERFFRSFGATPRPYYEIRRVDSPIRRMRQAGRVFLSRPRP